MNKKLKTERLTQETKIAECEKAVSLRHWLERKPFSLMGKFNIPDSAIKVGDVFYSKKYQCTVCVNSISNKSIGIQWFNGSHLNLRTVKVSDLYQIVA